MTTLAEKEVSAPYNPCCVQSDSSLNEGLRAVIDIPTKFVLNALGLSLAAEGWVALALAIPVSLLLVAIAYRIARR